MNEFEELAEEKSKEKHKREKKLKKEKKTKREREEDDGADGEEERRKKRKEKKRDKNDDDKKINNNDKKNEMHTLFFGQMPFDTKAKDIAPWLKANLNRQGCGRDIGQIQNGWRLTAKGRRGSRKSLKGLRLWILPPRKRRRKR